MLFQLARSAVESEVLDQRSKAALVAAADGVEFPFAAVAI